MKIVSPGTYPEENERVCPECNYKIIFDYQFTPTISWIDGICNWFRKISNKIINIFRKEKN